MQVQPANYKLESLSEKQLQARIWQAETIRITSKVQQP
jgi:hypothetical protein